MADQGTDNSDREFALNLASNEQDIIYEIDLKRGISYNDFLDRLSETVKPLSINLLVGEGNVSV